MTRWISDPIQCQMPRSPPETSAAGLTVPDELQAQGADQRSDARTIQQALDQLAAKGAVRKDGDEFPVETEMEGDSAKELNRTLLSH